jgi:hypothetical protein
MSEDTEIVNGKNLKLKDLLIKLKSTLMIEDALKAYLYEDKIELIDYTPAISLEEADVTMPDFYGHTIDLIVEKNVISAIDASTFSLFTPANKEVISELLDLIGATIIDYSEYEKLPSIEERNCVEV